MGDQVSKAQVLKLREMGHFKLGQGNSGQSNELVVVCSDYYQRDSSRRRSCTIDDAGSYWMGESALTS
jgi:hypothetical protein